jgi:DNA polymerase beta
METTQKHKKTQNTKKKKLIIKSSSSSSISKKNPRKKTQKKRKLIIASSTTSDLDKKENKENKNENKTDLNTKEQLHKMPARLNEQFIDLMEQLANIMLKQGEPFRARAYQKAQETIMSYPDTIQSPNDLKDKPNIGATIMDKLNEYVQTGTLQVLEREKTNPVNILGEVYGIGPKKAKELVDKGITTIEALRANQDALLNETQKVGLKYYEDILKRIPRAEIEEYKKIFTTEFHKQTASEPGKMEIVGSYRRGAESSGDIDVIITSTNPAIFKNFVDDLIKIKVIQEVLSRGPTKCLVIAKIPGHTISRRVDFLYTSPEEFPFAILYFTGSKIFNTVMRHEALAKDLTMNEHGLYSLISKKKGEKVGHVFNSEQDIFDYLGLEYKAPHERTDGRAVQKSEATLQKSEATLQKSEANEEEEPQINETIKTQIQNFKKNGINVLHTLSEHELTEMIKLANILYRNFQPIMTDNEYDILQDYITEKYPSNQEVFKVGAPVEKNKAQ